MGYKRIKFNQKGFNELEYKKYFNQNQAEYIRTKLRSVQLYNDGNEFEAVAKVLLIEQQSVRTYINIYIEGGFEELCKKVKRPQSSLLTETQSFSARHHRCTSYPRQALVAQTTGCIAPPAVEL